jgi:hypothetical protein
MKAWLVPLLFFAGSMAGCGGAVTGASGGSSGGDVRTVASSSTVGDDVAAIGLGGSSGGDAATTAPGGSSGGDAATTASGGSGGGLSPVPTDHRLQDVECPQERGPGSADIAGDCTQDSDCTEGMNGRCISPNVVGPLGRSRCSYDHCFSDSDCPGNEPCRCRPSAADNAPNYCVTGSNCRTDSDCGPGGFCSPSLVGIDSSIEGGGSFGYFCHTPQDLCLNHGDCDPSMCLIEQGCASLACGYSTESSHWDCFMVGTH